MLDDINLKITPEYCVIYPNRKKKKFKNPYSNRLVKSVKTKKQKENEKNLENNKTGGYLSRKATKRLKTSLNWLIYSSKKKKLFNRRTKKSYTFRVSFITLTLPAEQGDIKDTLIKKVALKPFIEYLKYNHGVNTYLWKAEAQKNGNIHFHIVVPNYIPYKYIRKFWNKRMSELGLINKYKSKFNKLELGEYCKLIDPNNEIPFNKKKNWFIKGKKTKWENPNTVDVQNMKRVKNIGAYIATYMSKKDSEKRGIQGRIWGCSYNISYKNKCVLELQYGADDDEINLLLDNSNNISYITTKPREDGTSKWLATVVSCKLDILYKKASTLIRTAIHNHIMKIRYYNYDESFVKNLLLKQV